MNVQLRAYLDEQASELDETVRKALAITNGDPIAALRASLIANSFLQEEIDSLKSLVSTGFTRGRVRKQVPKAHTADDFLKAVQDGTADKGARIIIWRLLRILTNAAKIDTSEPQGNWSLRVVQSPNSCFTNLFAEDGKR